jgi:murein DD-endopeptidase MepM/ murein hydrolase activator NlpD
MRTVPPRPSRRPAAFRPVAALAATFVLALAAGCAGDASAGDEAVPAARAATGASGSTADVVTTVPPTTVPPTTAPPATVPPTTVAPTTVPPTTVAPTTVPPTSAPPTTRAAVAVPPPPPAAPAPGSLPPGTETFRLPLNGRVSVSLAWDCGGCVAELGAKHHPAIDYVPRDDPSVVAAGSGLVLVVHDGCASPSQGCGESMGNSIFLRHVLADGSAIHTFYAHLAEIDPAVVAGRCVAAGQRLGRFGNSGIGSAPHLHFAFQVTPEILQYTVESSYEYGSRDPADYYDTVEVRPCA